LGHLSNDNNFPELAYITVKNILEEQSIFVDKDVKMAVAPRYGVKQLIKI
jgi:hypothetical protein